MHHPRVPETLEGWSVLHHMCRVRWDALKNLSPSVRGELAAEAIRAIQPKPDSGYSCLVHLLGHKADLMVTHFRRTFDDLSQVELSFQQAKLTDFLEMTTSYVSIVELGMYEMTAKIHQQLA